MKKIIVMLFLLSTAFLNSFAQTDFDVYIKEGIRLYDNRDYKGAVQQYIKALKIDNKSPEANYEIGLTYFALRDYKKSLEHSIKVINAKSLYVDKGYMLKGSSLDLLGNSKEAINTYKSAIKDYPNNYLLYYNLALTLYNTKADKKETENAVQHALKLNPSHSSSHLLIGYLMKDQNKRVEAILALCNFLLLEPTGTRAVEAYDKLMQVLSSKAAINNEGEFAEIEQKLNVLLEGVQIDKNKSDMPFTIQKAKAFFSALLIPKDRIKGFWSLYYADFFYALNTNSHTEAFCYYISQPTANTNMWLKQYRPKVDALLKWNTDYKRFNGDL